MTFQLVFLLVLLNPFLGWWFIACWME